MANKDDLCIFHYDACDTKEGLVSPRDYESWKTILNAAHIRNHAAIIQLAESLEENAVPKIFYHRQCRSRFTLKRDLNASVRTSEEAEFQQTERSDEASKRQKRMPSTSRVYQAICIFCEKENKCLKGTSTRENLIRASQLRVDEHLRQCATEKEDARIIAVTSRDIVAAEAHYHRSCYRKYIKPTTASTYMYNVQEADVHDAERQALDEVFTYIRNEIYPKKLITPLSQLTSRLKQFMQEKGVAISESAKKNFKRALENEMGEIIDIIKDEKGKLLVVPDSITICEVVLENQRLLSELELLRQKSNNNILIDQASNLVRTEIQKDFKFKGHAWPFNPDSVNLPNFLNRLLNGVINGIKESQKGKLLVKSLGQDLIYATTRGQHNTLKHVLLAYAVKTLTGNTELLQILNRLGHTISYTQLEEIDTALCLQKLAAAHNQRPILPAALQPAVFTNLAWDNIDRLEETLTGKGTSHRVNGIAVQPKVYGPHPPKQALPPIEKTKQRTIPIEHTELETYIAGKRIGPHPLPTSIVSDEAKIAAENSRKRNLLWVLGRLGNKDDQNIPSWTGFNIKARNEMSISEDVLCYLPTINAPATEMNTVLEIVNQSEALRVELQLPVVVLVVDQAIYAKVAEIVWRFKAKYANIVIRMGAFHTICNALAVLGKRFQDAGLRDLCIESGIVAEGSVTRVLDGKMYNRAVRVHKIIYEALMRLIWKEFMTNVMPDQQLLLDQVITAVKNIDINQGSMTSMLQNQDFVQLGVQWMAFLDHLRNSNGDLSEFWMSYLDMVEDILLGLLRASREGDWDLHLHAIRELIPWSFAYDRTNYSRYLSAYYAQMSALETTHPAVHEAFKEGYFSVQMSDKNPFGRLPIDQTLEVTVNRDTQTPGGTTKFSLQSGAVKRHYITAEHRSAFLGQLRSFIQERKDGACHADLRHSRVVKDEEAVSSVVDLLEYWVNPFANPQNIVSISTAHAATQEISADLLKAHEIGENCYRKFKEERLDPALPVTAFHDRIKLNKLKTFTQLSHTQRVTMKNGKAVMLKADRSLFGRIIVIAQTRNLNMADIFSHPLGPLPWALATPDGFLRKTSKATLAGALQKNVAPTENVPDNSATIIDGMSLVHKMSGNPTTFGEVAHAILKMALNQGNSSHRIDIVFDKYNEISVKGLERRLRGEQAGQRLQSIAPSQLVRQWRSFMSQSANKTQLIEFLVSMWHQPDYRQKLGDKIMYATVGDKCFLITRNGTEEASDLNSTQEEADGRLLLHAAHAAKAGYEVAVICSDDTDVFVLSIAVQDVVGCNILLKSGGRTRTKIVDVKKVAATLGACKGLIGLHAFTGCDSVSAFAGKGKVGALKLLTSDKDALESFVKLGQQFHVSPELIGSLEAVTCRLYAPKSTTALINDLRYNIFCAKEGEVESHQLPPCKDSLEMHVKRANYQAAIWRRCLEPKPLIPSPVGHGWKLEAEEGAEHTAHLTIKWMEGHPAPEAVLDLLACKCTTHCVLPRCVCLTNGLKCTGLCRLQDCENQETENEETLVDDLTDDLDD